MASGYQDDHGGGGHRYSSSNRRIASARHDRDDDDGGYENHRGYKNGSHAGYGNRGDNFRDNSDHKDTGGYGGNRSTSSRPHHNQSNYIDHDQHPHRGGENYRSRSHHAQPTSPISMPSPTDNHRTPQRGKSDEAPAPGLEALFRDWMKSTGRTEGGGGGSYADQHSGTITEVRVIKKFREMATQTTEDNVSNDSVYNGVHVSKVGAQIQPLGTKRGTHIIPDLKPANPPSQAVTSSLIKAFSNPPTTHQRHLPEERDSGRSNWAPRDSGPAPTRKPAEASSHDDPPEWFDSSGRSTHKSPSGVSSRPDRMDPPPTSWDAGVTSTKTTPVVTAGWGENSGAKGAGGIDWSNGDVTAFPDAKPTKMVITEQVEPFPAAQKPGPVTGGWGVKSDSADDRGRSQFKDSGQSQKSSDYNDPRWSSNNDPSPRSGASTTSQDKRPTTSEERFNQSRRDKGSYNSNSDNFRGRTENDHDSYSGGNSGRAPRWNNTSGPLPNTEQGPMYQRGPHAGLASSTSNPATAARRPIKDDPDREMAKAAWTAASQASKTGGTKDVAEPTSPTDVPDKDPSGAAKGATGRLATASDFMAFMQVAKAFVPPAQTGKKGTGSAADDSDDSTDEDEGGAPRPKQEEGGSQTQQQDSPASKQDMAGDEEEEEEKLERRPSRVSSAETPLVPNVDKVDKTEAQVNDDAVETKVEDSLLSHEEDNRRNQGASPALAESGSADDHADDSKEPAPGGNDLSKDEVDTPAVTESPAEPEVQVPDVGMTDASKDSTEPTEPPTKESTEAVSNDPTETGSKDPTEAVSKDSTEPASTDPTEPTPENAEPAPKDTTEAVSKDSTEATSTDPTEQPIAENSTEPAPKDTTEIPKNPTEPTEPAPKDTTEAPKNPTEPTEPASNDAPEPVVPTNNAPDNLSEAGSGDGASKEPKVPAAQSESNASTEQGESGVKEAQEQQAQ
ncbi:hypothetical protein B0O80DRAFT_491115 [Mortierella sp. GBAus27b]|nr:hypothetical protein BGX31_000917 [Mortierella sp. GBA43]KAI8346408.1 hypothetical protein B0O80DRAFT_491115 [Mortierella sp. GBAus27b]